MQPDHKVLDKDEWYAAHRLVAAWKNDPAATQTCPRCAAPGLKVVDNSARPYSEWYQLTCAGCGLDGDDALGFGPNPGTAGLTPPDTR